jgi:hypothetical protein
MKLIRIVDSAASRSAWAIQRSRNAWFGGRALAAGDAAATGPSSLKVGRRANLSAGAYALQNAGVAV